MPTVSSPNHIQSTLIISKSKGPSETLRDIRTSTYQMCRIEENTNRITKFHTWTCKLTPLVRSIYWKYCGTRREIAPEEQFLLLSTIFCYLMLDFYVKTGIRISLRDKRLFEITDVEITRVDYLIFWNNRNGSLQRGKHDGNTPKIDRLLNRKGTIRIHSPSKKSVICHKCQLSCSALNG